MLIDLMIALTLGLVVMMATCSLMVSATGVGTTTRENDIAYNAARQVLENVRQYKGAVVVDNTYTDATVFGSVPQLALLSSSATASVKVATYRGTMKQVTATVTWKGATTDRTGLSRSRKLSALIAPRGITR